MGGLSTAQPRVSNLSVLTNPGSLQEYFRQFGPLEDSIIMVDRDSSKSTAYLKQLCRTTWFWFCDF